MVRGKKFCIILDLNGSILARSRSFNSHTTLNLTSAFPAGPNKVLLRPGFGDFVEFLHRNFFIAIWTSATSTSLDLIFEGASQVCPIFQRENFEFCLSRESCQIQRWPQEEYLRLKREASGGWVKPLAVKDLERVWQLEGFSFNPKNTMILDDSPEKIKQSENHLWIPTFDPTSPDNELHQMQEYLKHLLENQSNIEDIRSYLSEFPFKKPLDWIDSPLETTE